MDFQDDEIKEILNIFQVESEEIIERLNTTLLELEKSPTNKDLIVLLFRDAHSLKGASRMIGFTDTQNLAHKLEDVLGLAKDDLLILTPQIADIMYKSVDLISKIISQSLDTGKETSDKIEVQKQINLLENIKSQEVETPIIKETSTEFNKNYFVENINNIHSLIVEMLLNLIKLSEKINKEDISNLYKITSELINHFQSINYFDIKSNLETINLKLDVILKCNSELSYTELEEIQKKADFILRELTNLCKKNELEIVDYYAFAFDGKHFETTEKNTVEDFENSNNSNISFETITQQISTLSNTSEHVEELILEFKDFSDKYQKTSCKNLINKILEIFKFIQKFDIKLDNSQLEIVQNCAEYCYNCIYNETPSQNEDMLVQQLTVIQQLIEISNPQIETSATLISQTSDEITQENKQKNKLKDFSKLLNSGEIKTLHVESTKLDNMVSQIGEMISTKIKTTKSLSEMSSVKKSLEDWQKDFSKLLRHIRLYDKKNSTSELSDKSSSILIKQLSYSMSEQNKKLNDIITNFDRLQNSNEEDDIKMRLLIDDFDEMVKNIRILPLATVFHLFGRMVRDISKERGKEVELTITGSETSADKKIIEEIKNPLIHIIRNSIDHGIETPQKRIELGKDPIGHIHINANHHENHILIEIIDDGQGFNIEKIKQKALAKGFLTEKELEEMSDKEIINIVFLPGFTTGDEVTSISGRGIGMDIVKSKIAQLNGTVDVKSEFNKGTKISIKLPVTMATMPAFLIQTSGQTFAIPMSAIKTVICKRKDELVKNQDMLTLLLNGKNIPLYNLSDLLNLEYTENNTAFYTILVIKTNNKKIGIIADKLLGEQEILQKKLAPPIYKLKNISGITTLASGESCLVLNILDLMKNATPKNAKKISSYNKNLITDKKELLKGKRILIVDDSKTVRTLSKNCLLHSGYNFLIETAQNPIEAFKILSQKHFDLILTDIEMPEMNGFEFLTQLKTNEMYFDIPVIVISSLSDKNVKKRAKSLGAEDYVIKEDFKEKNILDKISNILLKSIN